VTPLPLVYRVWAFKRQKGGRITRNSRVVYSALLPVAVLACACRALQEGVARIVGVWGSALLLASVGAVARSTGVS